MTTYTPAQLEAIGALDRPLHLVACAGPVRGALRRHTEGDGVRGNIQDGARRTPTPG